MKHDIPPTSLFINDVTYIQKIVISTSLLFRRTGMKNLEVLVMTPTQPDV